VLIGELETGETIAKVTDFGTSKIAALHERESMEVTNNVGTPV
jgi:hypothetical protein